MSRRTTSTSWMNNNKYSLYVHGDFAMGFPHSPRGCLPTTPLPPGMSPYHLPTPGDVSLPPPTPGDVSLPPPSPSKKYIVKIPPPLNFKIDKTGRYFSLSLFCGSKGYLPCESSPNLSYYKTSKSAPPGDKRLLKRYKKCLQKYSSTSIQRRY